MVGQNFEPGDIGIWQQQGETLPVYYVGRNRFYSIDKYGAGTRQVRHAREMSTRFIKVDRPAFLEKIRLYPGQLVGVHRKALRIGPNARLVKLEAFYRMVTGQQIYLQTVNVSAGMIPTVSINEIVTAQPMTGPGTLSISSPSGLTEEQVVENALRKKAGLDPIKPPEPAPPSPFDIL